MFLLMGLSKIVGPVQKHQRSWRYKSYSTWNCSSSLLRFSIGTEYLNNVFVTDYTVMRRI